MYVKLQMLMLKGALAKNLVRKILHLKFKKLRYIILKQTPLYKRTFPSECILNQVSTYFCLQAIRYFNIYRES